MPLGAVYHTHCAAVKTSFRPQNTPKRHDLSTHSTRNVDTLAGVQPLGKRKPWYQARISDPNQHLRRPRPATRHRSGDQARTWPKAAARADRPGPREATRKTPARAGGEAGPRQAPHGQRPGTGAATRERPRAAGHCTAAFKKAATPEHRQAPGGRARPTPQASPAGKAANHGARPQATRTSRAHRRGNPPGATSPQARGRATAAPGATAPEGAAPLPLGGWKGIRTQCNRLRS